LLGTDVPLGLVENARHLLAVFVVLGRVVDPPDEAGFWLKWTFQLEPQPWDA
jgi:hypothetical protein